MLYFALVLAAGLLIATNFSNRFGSRLLVAIRMMPPADFSSRFGGGWALAIAFCCIGILFGMMGILPVGLLSILLIAALAPEPYLTRRNWRYPVLSAISLVITLAIFSRVALHEQERIVQQRDSVPYESVEELLPPPHTSPLDESLPASSEERLTEFETSFPRPFPWSRTNRLRQLHEDRVALFVNNPGFGVVRVTPPFPSDLKTYGARADDLHVPQPKRGSAQPHLDITSEVRESGGTLGDLHRDSILDFINYQNFGYVKDRQHVAGFQSHRFSKVPDPAENWRVEVLDLVGLLLHEKPEAYVSADLPRMDELRKAPTRPLDRFEASGLEKLRGGEDLVVADTEKGLRMLGAIRNAKQCIECHGGKRGDLLGAFSYSLRER